jgi:uncharacterized protein (DUF4415 family)
MTNSPKTWAEARAAARRYAAATTPDEDARIQRGIEADPDTHELTDQDFQRMKPARGGRPPKPASERKQSVTLRLSPDVLEKYKATGRGWHTRIDEVLRREAPQEAAVGIVRRAAKRRAGKASRKIASPVAGKRLAAKSASKKSAAKAGSVKTTGAKRGRRSASRSAAKSSSRSSSFKR